MPPCPHCGVTQPADARLCQVCGESLKPINLRRIVLWILIVGVGLAVLIWYFRLRG
jgi:predicted nucleic acid-binding Zn ribbon protein